MKNFTYNYDYSVLLSPVIHNKTRVIISFPPFLKDIYKLERLSEYF